MGEADAPKLCPASGMIDGLLVLYDSGCLSDKGISEGRVASSGQTVRNCAYQLGVCVRGKMGL